MSNFSKPENLGQALEFWAEGDDLDEPDLWDEHGTFFGEQFTACMKSAAAITESLNLNETMEEFLTFSMWCIARLRRMLFTPSGVVKNPTNHIRDGSAADLLHRLCGTVARVVQYEEHGAEQSQRIKNAAIAFRSRVYRGKPPSIDEWRVSTKGLRIPNGSTFKVARLLAEAFDIAILHPTYDLHAAQPEHPIWQLEEQMTAISLNCNEIARLVRVIDADFRLAVRTIESCTCRQEFDLILRPARATARNRKDTAGQSEHKDAATSEGEKAKASKIASDPPLVKVSSKDGGPRGPLRNGPRLLAAWLGRLAATGRSPKEATLPLSPQEEIALDNPPAMIWPISATNDPFPRPAWSPATMSNPDVTSSLTAKHRCTSFSGITHVPDAIEEVRCAQYTEKNHECETQECTISGAENMSLASSGTLSTPSLPNPMHSTTSLSAPTLSLAEDFAGAELIVRGPWSAPMEHTRDFEIVLNKIRTSHSDEFVPPEGAVWGSAPFRKRTLTNSTSSEGRSSPFTLVTPELPQTESDKDEMTVKVKAKAKAKSLDDGKIIGKDWAEGYDGPQNMHKTGDSTSRSSPMLDKFDKFVNLVSRRQRKNTL